MQNCVGVGRGGEAIIILLQVHIHNILQITHLATNCLLLSLLYSSPSSDQFM